MDVSVDTTVNTESIVLLALALMIVAAFFVAINMAANRKLAKA